MIQNYANMLSGIRMVLSPVIFIGIIRSNFQLSLGLYLVALFTDLADGYIARKTGTSSNRGAFLDVLADFLLIFFGVYGYVFLGKISYWVLIVTILMFSQFILSFSGKIVYDPYGRFFGVFFLFSFPLVLAGSELVLILVNYFTYLLGFSSFIGRVHYLENRVNKTYPVKNPRFNVQHMICALSLEQ